MAEEAKVTLEEKERIFLEVCGFDISNGFWQEDLDAYKAKNPYKHHYFVVCGETKPIKE